MLEPFSRERENVDALKARPDEGLCEVTRLATKTLTPTLSRDAGEGVSHA
jgi:hypothetical protein